MENVNMATTNRMSLHTLGGCSQQSPVQSSTLIQSTQCGNDTNSNEGCVTVDNRPESFGPGFAAAGGGVYVTEYAASGIS